MYGGREVDIAIEQPPPRECGSGGGSAAAWWVLVFFCLLLLIFGGYAGYSQDNRDRIAVQCQQFAEKATSAVAKLRGHVRQVQEAKRSASTHNSPQDSEKDQHPEPVGLAEETTGAVVGQTLEGAAVNTKQEYSSAKDQLQYVNPQACPGGDTIHMPKAGGTMENASGQVKEGAVLNEDKQIMTIRQLRKKIDNAIAIDREWIMDRDGSTSFLGPLSFNRPVALDWQRLRHKIKVERDQKGAGGCDFPETNGSSWLQ